MAEDNNFWRSFIGTSLKNPTAFFRNLNKENYNKLLFALKTESPDRILNNIHAYFKKYNEVKERNVELEIDKLVINSSSQLNYLFISHEATRTGAPLIVLELAKRLKKLNGIEPIFILCNGGEIEKDFKKSLEQHIPFEIVNFMMGLKESCIES